MAKLIGLLIFICGGIILKVYLSGIEGPYLGYGALILAVLFLLFVIKRGEG